MKLQVSHRKIRDFQFENNKHRTGSSNHIQKSRILMQQNLTRNGTLFRLRGDIKSLKSSMINLSQKESDFDGTASQFIDGGKNAPGTNFGICQEVNEPTETQESSSNLSHGPYFNHSGYQKHIDSIGDEKNNVVLLAELYDSLDSPATKDKQVLAHHLPYTREELKILTLLGPQHGVTDDVRAGIIWHAIEREQLSESKNKRRPLSSSLILNLLLSPTIHDVDDVAILKDHVIDLSDDDAVLVHVVDVVLSHYALDAHKINPCESWTGAGRNISMGKTGNKNENVNNRSGSVESWWRSYYSMEILGSSKNSVRMKKGHKITSCLLSLARHMQLNERNRQGISNDIDSFTEDQDSNPLNLPKDIEFVSEVMRLMVAHWRESSPSSMKTGGLIKRGRKKRNHMFDENEKSSKTAKSKK